MNVIFAGCRIVLLSATLLIASCTVHSNQLDLLTSLIKPKPDALAAYRWRVEFNGDIADVIAVTTPEGTLFVNNDNDVITFDGWTITEVQGLGLASNISVKGRVGERVMSQNSRGLERQRCEDWQKVTQGSTVVYEQHCVGIKRYLNRISLDSGGAIVKIVQHFGFKEFGDNTAMTLIKL
jgi:hypothetical protein